MHGPTDRPLRITPGVRFVEGVYIQPELGIAIPHTHTAAREQLLAFGLASEVCHWSRIILTPPSRAVPLRSALLAAAAQSIAHNAIGMLRWWFIICSIGIGGMVAHLPSFMGIALAAALFLISILCHEAGHVVAYRLAAESAAPGILVSKGARCHLVRAPLPTFRDRFVIVGGAAGPLLIAVLMLPSVFVLPMLFWAWTSIALGHAIFLFVPIGDGVHLRSSFA